MTSKMAIPLSAAALLAVAASHAQHAQAQTAPLSRPEPKVEYLLKSLSYNIRSSFSSGPDVKTKSSSSMQIKVSIAGIHDYPRTVHFVVIKLRGYGDDDKEIPLN